MPLVHLMFLIALCIGLATLFGWLWIGMRRGRLWGTVGYTALVALYLYSTLNNQGNDSLAMSMLVFALGTVLLTAIGLGICRLFGATRHTKSSEHSTPEA